MVWIRASAETLARIVNDTPLALVVANNRDILDDLRDAATNPARPCGFPERRGRTADLLPVPHGRALARRITLHGVFMEVHSIGVLLTGESGLGK